MCGTFNVGNHPIEDLGSWIAPRGEIAALGPGAFADVIALGMQESTWGAKKAKKAKMVQSAESDSDDDDDDDDDEGSLPLTADTQRASVLESGTTAMKAALAAHLGPEYALRAHVQRGQMRLLVFVRIAPGAPLTEFAAATGAKACDLEAAAAENVGLGGVGANKGGQLLALRLGGTTTLAFVSAHLNAHEGEAKRKRRNEDVAEILSGARAGRGGAATLGLEAVGDGGGGDAYWRAYCADFDTPSCSHHAFFVGDLNYRVALAGFDREKTLKPKPGKPPPTAPPRGHDAHHAAVCTRTLGAGGAAAPPSALEHEALCAEGDELLAEMGARKVFAGWTTPPTPFAPTFKASLFEGRSRARARARASAALNRFVHAAPSGEATHRERGQPSRRQRGRLL